MYKPKPKLSTLEKNQWEKLAIEIHLKLAVGNLHLQRPPEYDTGYYRLPIPQKQLAQDTSQIPHRISRMWEECHFHWKWQDSLGRNEFSFLLLFFLNLSFRNLVQNVILKCDNSLSLLVSVWRTWILESYKSN